MSVRDFVADTAKQMLEFQASTGRLPHRVHRRTCANKEEDVLARKWALLRTLRNKSDVDHQLSEAEMRWLSEKVGPEMWKHQLVKETYIPAEDVLVDADGKPQSRSRHIFCRVPTFLEPVSCYLCGQGASNKQDG